MATHTQTLRSVAKEAVRNAPCGAAVSRKARRKLRCAPPPQVGQALLLGKVPEHWLAKSFPSLKPLGPYVREVIDRCDFFARWLAAGPPVAFWLPAFFFTQAFLTGAKQNFARKYKVPIDIVDYDFAFRDGEGQCDARPDDGVLVHGARLCTCFACLRGPDASVRSAGSCLAAFG